MSPTDALSTLLKSYNRYYNVVTEGVESPFAAEAIFHTHDEQYFLVKSAKLAEAESNEYVFFYTGDSLDLNRARTLDQCAWERGLSRTKPGPNHRNTDVTLILLAERIAPDAADFLKKTRHYQSYRFTFHGWSSYRVVALETSTGTLSHNKQGKDLKKLFRNIQSRE